MSRRINVLWIPLLAAVLVMASMTPARAFIDGLTGTTFNFIADKGRLTTPDGASLLFWGFGNAGAPMPKPQYPGPTLIVNEGDVVTINLTNMLPEPVSLVFPGLEMLTRSAPVVQGGDRTTHLSIAPTAAPNNAVPLQYRFRATKPGTYYYQSGSNQQIQLRMGLFGAIIVRPSQNGTQKNIDLSSRNLNVPAYAGVPAGSKPFTKYSYNDGDGSTGYDREYLFLVSEMDPNFQHWVEFERPLGKSFDFSKWKANYWFMNGRNAPDTMAMPNFMLLPYQPYNCMPLMHPGETVLMRFINMGQDFHPFHTHGNHMRVVAEDSRLLSSDQPANPSTTGADLSWQAFTITMAPGKTMDATFTWTGEKLGWDFYNHDPNVDMPAPFESLLDHAKGRTLTLNKEPGVTIPNQSLPVVLPRPDELTVGMSWSGSPFMGNAGALPPGEGGFNPFNGFFYMWHSHSERELTNNNIFPGGFLTMMGVVPWPMNWAPGQPDNIDAFDMYNPGM